MSDSEIDPIIYLPRNGTASNNGSEIEGLEPKTGILFIFLSFQVVSIDINFF